MIHVLAVAEKNISTATDVTNRPGNRFQEEFVMIELSDVRNELDKTAKELADFRGSL